MKVIRLVFFLNSVLSLSALSQEGDCDVRHDVCMVDPAFPGGNEALWDFICANLEYPQESIELGEEGVVYIHFVVNKDGSIQDVSVRKGLSDPLNKEAVRILSLMPN